MSSHSRKVFQDGTNDQDVISLKRLKRGSDFGKWQVIGKLQTQVKKSGFLTQKRFNHGSDLNFRKGESVGVRRKRTIRVWQGEHLESYYKDPVRRMIRA